MESVRMNTMFGRASCIVPRRADCRSSANARPDRRTIRAHCSGIMFNYINMDQFGGDFDIELFG